MLVQEKEEEGKLKQIPVYFASEALSGSKIFYSELEKIAHAVIMATAMVGNGSSRTITNSSRKLQIRSCRCGLFH
jgi:hypothetical protein